MKNLITLDYNYLMADVIGGSDAISVDDIDAVAQRAEATARRIESERERGDLAFLDIDQLKRHVPAIKRSADQIKRDFKKLVVLGIGGSALGARTIQEALVNPQIQCECEVIIVDNIDPVIISRLIQSLDLKTTAFNVISKSGGTVETLAQFMIFADLLKKQLGDSGFRERVVITTDPERGVLREIATQEGITALDVDPKIGGRFSVLTPVGLFPAECMGVDSNGILDGAAVFLESVDASNWRENPAYMYGLLLFIAATKKRKNISVMMPYSGRLFTFALWYCQLWAESLGKTKKINGGETEGVGQTPVAAVGVTDQHSQLQLFMEGPRDKVITFMRVTDHGDPVIIPKVYVQHPSMRYLGLKGLSDLFSAETSATEAALARQGRPSITLIVPDLSPQGLGALFLFFQVATTFYGYLSEINPFDQPGVEEGKKYTWGIMGREGYTKMLKEYHSRPKKSPTYTLSIGSRKTPPGAKE